MNYKFKCKYVRTDVETSSKIWRRERILSAYGKTPRKQGKSFVTLVSLKHGIAPGMCFYAPLRYSR